MICTADGWQLFWKPSIEDRNAVLRLNADSMEPSPFVVGPNWLINSSADLVEYERIAEAMNGVVWVHTDPIPAE